MYLRVKVCPNSKKTKINKAEKLEDGNISFVIDIKEPAKNGLANQSIKIVLSEYLNINPDKLRLISGGLKPSKVFKVIS